MQPTNSPLNPDIEEAMKRGQHKTFIYQGSEVLAWQQQNGSTQTMAWEHRDVSNASVNISGLPEGSNAAELEPLGMDAGTFHLIAPPPSNYRPPLKEARDYPGFADMVLGSQCRVDGIDMPCGMAGSEATALCPPSGCRSLNLKTNQVEYFHAYADRYQGYSAVNAEYQGNGAVWTPDNSSVLINQNLAGTQDSSVTVGPGVQSFLEHTGGGEIAQQILQQSAPLSTKKEAKYDKAKDKLLGRLGKMKDTSKCAQFLARAGISISDLIDTVNKIQPYDGSLSGISRKDAGIISYDDPDTQRIQSENPVGFAQFENGPVSSDFRRGSIYGALAGTNNRVYFNPRNGLNSNAIFHESLHELKGLGDVRLAQALELNFTGGGMGASLAINAGLKKNGCTR
jgi:hypothetical protein